MAGPRGVTKFQKESILSSTNRGGRRSEADAYPTPEWAVRRLLESPRVDLPRGRWMECCAGDGAIIRAVNLYREGAGLDPINWFATELRGRMRPLLEKVLPEGHLEIADYLDPSNVLATNKYQVTITNPPFYLAYEMLQRAMQNSEHVLFLLRLNFFGSELRHAFLKKHMPSDVYVIPNRPSFRGDNKTDSIEYAWFHWKAPYENTAPSKTHLLELTAKEERRVPLSLIELA